MAGRKFETQAEQAAYELGLQDAKADAPEPLTLEAIKGMSQEEVAARLPEVNAVLAGAPDGQS